MAGTSAASSTATARAICSTRRARSSRPDDPETFRRQGEGQFVPAGVNPGRAVHMMDIHAENGLQCADCHFARTPRQRLHLWRGRQRDRDRLPRLPRHRARLANLRTSGPAAPTARHQPGGAPQRGRPPPLRMDGLRAGPRGGAEPAMRDGQPARPRPALDRRSEPRAGRCSRSTTAVDATCRPAASPAQRQPGPCFNMRSARAKLMSRTGAETGRYSVRPRRAREPSSPIRPRRWPASPATSAGRRAAAAATCRSRRTSGPAATIMRARRRATSRPTTRRSRARTCSSSAATRPARAISSPRSARPRRWCCRRPTSIESGSTSSSRRSLPPASRARPSRRISRTRCARPRPSNAPTAMSAGRTTIMRSWRSCCCRAPTS